MAKLIYSLITSLDGYAEAADGDLGTGADDQEVHTFINDLFRPGRHVTPAWRTPPAAWCCRAPPWMRMLASLLVRMFGDGEGPVPWCGAGPWWSRSRCGVRDVADGVALSLIH